MTAKKTNRLRLIALLCALAAALGLAVWFYSLPGTSDYVFPASPPVEPIEGPAGERLGRWVQVLGEPVDIQHAGDGSGRLFVVDKHGTVFAIDPQTREHSRFLSIADRINSGASERGLLGLAFSPTFPEDGRLYVYYTARDGTITISRFLASPSSAPSVDTATEEVLLQITHPYVNHNGGQLRFGPDGMLWIGTGDGGGGGDPDENADNPASLLGKMLRLDVDGPPAPGLPYAIPPGNRPTELATDRPEIWAIGLRNPWRWAFHPESGDLYIADVGQNEREEIDVVSSLAPGGLDLGWDRLEGTRCYEPPEGCDGSGTVMPAHEYPHGEGGGCSITGGIVYRGAVASLRGKFLFADFCGGWVRGLSRPAPTAGWEVTEVFATPQMMISAFGEDEAGEAYVADLRGWVYRIDAALDP